MFTHLTLAVVILTLALTTSLRTNTVSHSTTTAGSKSASTSYQWFDPREMVSVDLWTMADGTVIASTLSFSDVVQPTGDAFRLEGQ